MLLVTERGRKPSEQIKSFNNIYILALWKLIWNNVYSSGHLCSGKVNSAGNRCADRLFWWRAERRLSYGTWLKELGLLSFAVDSWERVRSRSKVTYSGQTPPREKRDKRHFVGAIVRWKEIVNKLGLEIRNGKTEILGQRSSKSNGDKKCNFSSDWWSYKEDMMGLPTGFSYRNRKWK